MLALHSFALDFRNSWRRTTVAKDFSSAIRYMVIFSISNYIVKLTDKLCLIYFKLYTNITCKFARISRMSTWRGHTNINFYNYSRRLLTTECMTSWWSQTSSSPAVWTSTAHWKRSWIAWRRGQTSRSTSTATNTRLFPLHPAHVCKSSEHRLFHSRLHVCKSDDRRQVCTSTDVQSRSQLRDCYPGHDGA